MTEDQREKFEQRWDDAEELQESTAQRKESLDLEILHLRGEHEIKSNKVRELERCEDTRYCISFQKYLRYTFETRFVRRDRNKTSSKIDIRQKEAKMCENKLTPQHLIPNENLTNGLLKKSERETCGRVQVQLPHLTATPAKTTSWFNQRTEVALKVVEEQKIVQRTLDSRPGFSVQATEENGVDIVDSLDLDDLPMPSFEKVSELLQDKKEKTKPEVEESKVPSLAVPTDPRRRPSTETPEVKKVNESKVEEKEATPLELSEKASLTLPRDPRRRPSTESLEEKNVTDSRLLEKQPGKGVDQTKKPSLSVPTDPRTRPSTNKPDDKKVKDSKSAEKQPKKSAEQTRKPSLPVPRDPRRRPSKDSPEDSKSTETKPAQNQAQNIGPQQKASTTKTIYRKVTPSPAKKPRSTSPDHQKNKTSDQAPLNSNEQSQRKRPIVPKGRVFAGNTPEKLPKTSDQAATPDSLKSRNSPPKYNKTQDTPEPFVLADGSVLEPIVYDRSVKENRKQGGSLFDNNASNFSQSSKPRDPNSRRHPRYSPPRRVEPPFEHQGRSSRLDYPGQHSNSRHFAQQNFASSRQGSAYPGQGPTKRLNSDTQRPSDPHRKRQKTNHHAGQDVNVKAYHQNRRSPTEKAAQIQKFKLFEMPDFE